MHFLSHVQHALSDAMVNMSQNTPRHVRARPIPSALRLAPSAAPNPSLFRPPATGATPSTSSSPQETRPMEVDNGSPAPAPPPAFAEVEVNIEPIIVGIEVEHGDMDTVTPDLLALRQRVQGNLSQVLQMQMVQSGLMNATRPSASSAEASTSEAENNAGQDSQARGDTQTQPTTSTQTRSSPHVHPRAVGQLTSMMMAPPFDPLLPCSSHHVSANFGHRTRHPAGSTQLNSRPRSASVPPRNQPASSSEPQPAQPNSGRLKTSSK